MVPGDSLRGLGGPELEGVEEDQEDQVSLANKMINGKYKYKFPFNSFPCKVFDRVCSANPLPCPALSNKNEYEKKKRQLPIGLCSHLSACEARWVRDVEQIEKWRRLAWVSPQY